MQNSHSLEAWQETHKNCECVTAHIFSLLEMTSSYNIIFLHYTLFRRWWQIKMQYSYLQFKHPNILRTSDEVSLSPPIHPSWNT